jgi:hypothetical protein
MLRRRLTGALVCAMLSIAVTPIANGATSSWNLPLSNIRSIALDQGTPVSLYVLAGDSDRAMFRYSAASPNALLSTSAAMPPQTGYWGVGIMSDGKFWTSAQNDEGLIRLDSAGASDGSISFFPTNCCGRDLAVDRANDNLYVLTHRTDDYAVRSYSPGRAPLAHWGAGRGSGTGQFYDQAAIAVGSLGRVYVGENDSGSLFRNSRIQYFAADGTYLGAWGSRGSASGQFTDIRGMGTDPLGNVYVAEYARVQKFSPTGEYVGSYSPGGTDVAADASGNVYVANGSTIMMIDRYPIATLANVSTTVGTSASITASANLPFGSITKYEWDLDGNGTYETDTGLNPTVAAPSSNVGTFTIGLRVTGSSGETTTTTALLIVNPRDSNVPGGNEGCSPAPGGPIGVSILDGAVFTNNPNVTIDTVWPACTQRLTISNDGGFKNARSFAVSESLDWTLVTSGPERLPKTVYLRFGNSSQTYTDDIILDETDPTISRVTVSTSTARAGHPNGRAKTTVSVTTIASDKTSGVGRIQITSSKKKPGPLLKYKKTVRASVSGSAVWVRVQDKAGNFSAWKRAGA